MRIPRLTVSAYEKTYQDGYNKQYPSIELVRIEKLYFKKKGMVLDYGCGPGSNGIHFLLNGYQVVFCDISKTALRNLKIKLSKLNNKYKKNYKIINILNSQNFFKKFHSKFDYIVCFSVLNNFPNYKAADQYIKKFNNILKKNGKLIIDSNLKNRHNYKKILFKDKEYYSTNPNNKNFLKMFFPSNISEFKKLIKKNNFVIDDIGYSKFKVFSTKESEVIISAQKNDGKNKYSK